MANTINRQQLITDLISNGFEQDRRFWHNGTIVFIKSNNHHIDDEVWEIYEDSALQYKHGYLFDPVEYKLI